MADEILTNVLMQSADLIVRTSRVGPLVQGEGTKVCDPEPLRLLLLVVQDDPVTELILNPNATTTAAPLTAVELHNHALIHASVYPGLIRLPWYVIASQADTVTVYEVLRTG